MVRNVGGTPRPFGDDKKKKISINDASTNGSVIKISSLQESLWKKQARQNAIDSSRQTQAMIDSLDSNRTRSLKEYEVDNILIQNLTDIVSVFNENRYDIFKMKQELMMLRDDLNVWLEMNQADTQKQINETK
tara:strand:- start:989 stop:1387 length:399 start_codon:yes stop_codon:yes gene_type:complete